MSNKGGPPAYMPPVGGGGMMPPGGGNAVDLDGDGVADYFITPWGSQQAYLHPGAAIKRLFVQALTPRTALRMAGWVLITGWVVGAGAAALLNLLNTEAVVIRGGVPIISWIWNPLKFGFNVSAATLRPLLRGSADVASDVMVETYNAAPPSVAEFRPNASDSDAIGALPIQRSALWQERQETQADGAAQEPQAD